VKRTSFLLLIMLGVITMFFMRQGQAQSELPASVDLSETPYFPPISDQGNIGSCDWFAAVYYQMTFLYNKQCQRAAAPENTFSPQFGYNILNNAGSFPFNIRVDDVYKFVKKHGSATMSEYPYNQQYLPWCTDGTIWRHAISYRITEYSFFTYRNEAPLAQYSFEGYADFFHEIKRLLSEGEVLVIQSETFAGSFSTVADDPATGEDDRFVGESIQYSGRNGPEHTLAIVGYNDHIWVDLNRDRIVQPNEKGALKIADSGGIYAPNHNKGFLWMTYSTVDSSIFQHRVNRMSIRTNYTPKVIGRITLTAAERDKIKFQFGRSKNMGDAPAVDHRLVFDPYGLGYEAGTAGVSLIAGGNIAFDGGGVPSDGTFVFDLTDIYADNTTDYWYLKIKNSGNQPVIIKEFEIFNSETSRVVKDRGLPYSLVQQEVYRYLQFNNREDRRLILPTHNQRTR
jgi:hypothetical protein